MTHGPAWLEGRRTRASSAISTAAFAWAIGTATAADFVDPSVSHSVYVGGPSARAPMPGLNAARSNVSPYALPMEPRVLWETRTPGTPLGALAVDALGAVIGATGSGQVYQLDPDGRRQWELKVEGGIVAGPVLLAGGTRFVVTGEGALAIDATGVEQWRTALALQDDARAPAPLPTADGGVVVAFGKTLLRLGPRGTLRARTPVNGEIVRLVGHKDNVYAVDSEGGVWLWKPNGLLSPAGSFGRPITGEAVWSGSTLTAVTQGSLVSVNPRTHQRHVLAETGSAAEPIVAAPGGALQLVTSDGQLATFSPSGRVTRRLALRTMSGRASHWLARGMIRDPRGAIATAIPGRGVALVGPLGEVHWLSSPRCANPVAIAPHGPSQLVVSCDIGLILLVGAAAPERRSD